MSHAIQLQAGALRCEIKPEQGGCIAGLWLGDIAVLRSMPARELDSVRKAGSYPLVPFSNRMGQARLKWEGTSHPLVQNFAPEPHAIHGIGWQRPWTVLESDTHFALLSCEHKPDGSWPFAFDSSQTFRITEHALELTLGMTNQSDKPAPAGLGWHPYFMKRARSRISFEATGRWEMGPDMLPTQRKAAHGLDADCAFLDVDNCYDGWNGIVHLRDELLHTRITSKLSRLVVYTNDTRDYIAIEPVSHVNNALNMLEAHAGKPEDLGVCILQPGQSLSATMTIETERVK